MSLGRDRYSYRAAITGEAPEVPEPLMQVVKDRENWAIKWAEALRLLYRSAEASRGDASHTKYRTNKTTWEFCQEITDSDQEHHDYMRAVVYKAKQSPRFWGVADDEEERYCSRCRSVKPREDFNDETFYCHGCA